MKIVGVGGGTGLPILLSGLAELSGNAEILTGAVVCVSDTGGSRGRLRDRLKIPAVADLRDCLVLPSTEVDATLCAQFEDGQSARGEGQIRAAGKRVARVWLEPENPPAAPGVLEAIRDADTIVLGPGSLYTSIVPSLLAAGVAEAIRRSRALKTLVCNLMTEPGETEGLSAADHLRVLLEYLGEGAVNVCLLSASPLDERALQRCAARGCYPVQGDEAGIVRLGALPVVADLLPDSEAHVRHDPAKLARLVVTLTRGALQARGFASADPLRLAAGTRMGTGPRADQ